MNTKPVTIGSVRSHGVRQLLVYCRGKKRRSGQRATELGVSLVIGDEGGSAIGTRTLRCTNGFIDPLLKKLKDVHGK